MGIVHRDVSPSNILVSARGEVKLFDFGIVKAEGRVTKTQHGVVKGNVSFMSPEQARGIDVDGRADLFSLGLVIFYCLTGEILYQRQHDLRAAGQGGDRPRRRGAGAHRRPARPVRRDRAQGAGGRSRPSAIRRAAEFGAALAPHVAGGAAEAGAPDEHAVRRGLPRRGGPLRRRDPEQRARARRAATRRDYQNRRRREPVATPCRRPRPPATARAC